MDVVDLFFDSPAVQTNVDVIMNEDPISSLISDRREEDQHMAPLHSALQPQSAKNKTKDVDTTAILPEQLTGQENAARPPSGKPKRIRDRRAERERREQKLASLAAQAAENAGKLASLARNRRGMTTRSTAKVETPVAEESIAAGPPVEEEKPNIPTESAAPLPVEPASILPKPLDPPAQPDNTSTSQPQDLSEPVRPKVMLPTPTPKQEPSMSPLSPAPFQAPHIEYTFHHWAPELGNQPRAPEPQPQPERHFQPEFLFHQPQQQHSFHNSFLPSQTLSMYHQPQIPHLNSMYPPQYQQPTDHYQSLWVDLESNLFSETLQQHQAQHQPPNAFSIDPSFRPVLSRQMTQHPTYSPSQALPRIPPIVTPTLLQPTHFSRYATAIPPTPTHHLPSVPELNPNQFRTVGIAGVPHQHIPITHPVWAPSSQPISPDRDSKKRKRSEYERQIQIPAVLDTVDKKDEFAHFEQGYVLSEGSRRTRQGRMTPSRIDSATMLPISKSPERRATSSKRSHVSASVANEPPVNLDENGNDQRTEKKLSKTEKLKLRKLKDKERNQKRRDQVKREKEARIAGGRARRSDATSFPPGQSQVAGAAPNASALGTTGSEMGDGEQHRQPPLEDLFDGETSSLSSLSDLEDDQPPTTVDTQPSAPTDSYGTNNSRASTLSPLPPSPLPRMSTRDRRGKFTVPVLQIQDDNEGRAPTVESEQSKEPSGRNRSRAALGSLPEAGPDGKLEGGTLGEDGLTLIGSHILITLSNLVWAKQEGHPWFPAVIHDGTEEEIPPRVQEAKEEICSTMTVEERNTLQVVRFYDKAFNWYERLPVFKLPLVDTTSGAMFL